ncbi:NAD-binding protein [Sulfurimonas sp.]|jgi:Trk K+ transport system NAD-binding subunit|uniref:NAD-binding protein n=1 Tax=Sulfurimonas sp. TaxID=2022749 RepID=UPI002A369270|nr:NAD-binding protein [Sulfurimonas sp.]MDY0123148.1 NAD-binding protein [Sulfurimonas sp.]
MRKSTALLFGYNDYTLEIVKNISLHYENIKIFRLDESSDKNIQNSKYEISRFDLSDDWDELKVSVNIDECTAFCLLEDTAENIFLTISLREAFENLTIVALAEDKESADKLSLTGASRVIPTIQTTANMIVEMLEKPIITQVLHNILYEKSDLKIAQIRVDNVQKFEGVYPYDIDWGSQYNVFVLSVLREDMETEFIYSAKARHHQIKEGDVFVVVGYESDLGEFERIMGSRYD